MYLIKITVKESEVEGEGVFALEDIQKDAIVWKFNPTYDNSTSAEEFEKLDADTQAALLRVAYFSPTSKLWVYPPEGDPSNFTNHSDNDNNLTAIVDMSVSNEPFFIANRDIKVGEELTVNYLEFDKRTGRKVLEWQ